METKQEDKKYNPMFKKMESEKTKTLKEIATIMNINFETLRLYLSRPEFTKYLRIKMFNNRRKKVFVFNKNFRQELCDFLELKQRFDCVKLLMNYKEDEKEILFEQNEKLKAELDTAHCQNKRLQDKLEMVSKQYNSLLKYHNEWLAEAKRGLNSYENCIQSLEKENERLKQILTDNDICEVKK